MAEELTKESITKLMKIKGEVRGVVFKTDEEFILKEKGKQGLKKVEEELKRTGHPIDYKKIETMAFYPLGLRIVSLLIIQKVLKFSEKDIELMGARAPKTSLVIKLFIKFFFSISKTMEQVPKIWEKHYTVGRLSAQIYEKEKYAVVRLKDLTIHSIFCRYLKGYFSTVLKMVVKAPVTAEETKCLFKGDEYHEFVLRW